MMCLGCGDRGSVSSMAKGMKTMSWELVDIRVDDF